jgi:hypothetical protein
MEKTDVIDRSIKILEQRKPEKIGTQRRVAANIDALERFRDMLDSIDLFGCDPAIGSHSPPKLVIRNVEVSVRPEIILRGSGKTGKLVGAVKLYFPVTYPLDDASSGYISTILQEWCNVHVQDDGSTHGLYCFAIDVGTGRQWPGVRATSARLKDVEAACQNIAALWPTIDAAVSD